jgi:hypothetical protein
MTTETQQLNPFSRGWRWLWKMGIAFPLIAGVVLAGLAVMTLVSPGYEAPHEVKVGAPADYTYGEPVFFEEERFWISRLPSGELIALYDRDPITGCTVPWDKNHEALGLTGWFHDACSTSVYDLSGACFSGPCEIGLNRLDLREENGEITVDMRNGDAGALRDDEAIPLAPPQ